MLYGEFETNFTVRQGSLLVAVALSAGVNIAVATDHFREHVLALQQGGARAAGATASTGRARRACAS